MKLLSELLYKSGIEEVNGITSIRIDAVIFDSRKAEDACLFVAIRGTTNDGHQYIKQVISNGAIAIICEQLPDEVIEGITYVRVKDSSVALANIASNFYDHPSSKIKLIGVTGTNGKTTTVTLLYELFKTLGHKCGLLSTVVNKINNTIIPSTHTTPDPLSINQLLNEMIEEGCEYCFIEVSSHAVVQNRITALQFAGAIFTNITRDHLDYHITFDEYIRAKKGFFDLLSQESFALINADDRNHKIMVQNSKANIKTYAMKSMADFKVKVLENNFAGLLINIDTHDVHCRLVGSFNAYNLLATYSTAVLLNIEPLNVLTALSNLTAPEGRFEYLQSANAVIGIVDYAHTPDALQNVLLTIKDIRTLNEKVITVIGCGGNRDAGKRPEMAAIACELSDKVILTSDNPRNEDPSNIIAEMQAGVPGHHYKKVLSIVDRKEAVRTACALAKSGDIILIAGKGHEKYQEINGVKYPFDDKKILEESFELI